MHSPFSLEAKSILVTGASSGIGRQTCISISQMGGRVIAVGRNLERLDETMQALEGEGHRAVASDLTDSQELEKLVGSMSAIDGIIHSAGIITIQLFRFVNQQTLRNIQTINYEAPVMLTQQLLRKKLLKERSSIVFIASVAGLSGAKAHSLYAGSKGAIIALSRALALELAPQGIRVNCLAPGLIRTPMMEKTKNAISAASLEQYRQQYPLGFGEPQDVANAAVYLLSDASRWMTGTVQVLDGGFSCQ